RAVSGPARRHCDDDRHRFRFRRVDGLWRPPPLRLSRRPNRQLLGRHDCRLRAEPVRRAALGARRRLADRGPADRPRADRPRHPLAGARCDVVARPSQTGLGWGFGLHQALDQLGAVLGPLIVSGILFAGNGYLTGFAWLLVPALLSMTVLLAARLLFPRPHDFELAPPLADTGGLAPVFWVYIAAVACIAAGYADFPLIAYHFAKAQIMPAAWIPILFAVAMGVDGVGALALGSLFDRIGIRTMILATIVSAAAAPLVFLGNFLLAVIGMACWGLGTGAGFGHARDGGALGAAAAPRHRLRHYECDLWRRLVRRQRPAGVVVRPLGLRRRSRLGIAASRSLADLLLARRARGTAGKPVGLREKRNVSENPCCK